MAATGTTATVEHAFAAALPQIGPASSWVSQVCRALGVAEEAIARLDICMNEVVANILSHGGAGALAAPIRLHLSVEPGLVEGVATLTVSDHGVPFDASRCPVRAAATTLADAQPGGLGVVMLRANADDLAYSYHDGENRLGITVRWQSA
jgi:anti-sigma regulatory factor (Ser/Thr protein kinase)